MLFVGKLENWQDATDAIPEDFEPEIEPCEDCNPKKILIDLKTSSSITQYYPEGCVEDSRQLAIYAMDCGLDLAGYLVIEKYIRKREPRIRLEFITGTITEEQIDKVFDEIAEVTMDIKEEKFEKNENSCYKFGKCDYYNLCHYGSKKGLEEV